MMWVGSALGEFCAAPAAAAKVRGRAQVDAAMRW